ncbi:MAG: superoxide dismutase [Bacteroidia bacterium]|nr:superoxide dismutase [Bacteroidia bacterium]MCZ2278506.1 superoxide dismutase [Bacteroidia bacterium]
MSFNLPKLPYTYHALEPHIDAQTMEIHYGKHHQGYVNNLNNAIAGTEAEKMSIDDICKNVSKFSTAIRNNGGGHWNHSFFWQTMKPGGGGQPSGTLADAVNAAFGSFDELKSKFNAAGAGRFGSGWAWLIKNASGKLEICSTPNQDNPLMDIAEVKGIPVIGCDVWEHAYYLHYQNRRGDYLAAWWNVINWDEAAKRFSS